MQLLTPIAPRVIPGRAIDILNVAPSRGMSPVAGLIPGGVLAVIGLAIIALRPDPNAPAPPRCVPCGAFATHTIAGQPVCEEHARAAVNVGWQAEPIC